MNLLAANRWRASAARLFALLLSCTAHLCASAIDDSTNEIRIVALEGTVELSPKDTTRWVFTQTNQVLKPGDRLRVGDKSRAWIVQGRSLLPLKPGAEIEIAAPQTPQAGLALRLLRGVMSFFHRDKPGGLQAITAGGVAGIEGTEFVLKVEPGTEMTTIWVIDGKVSLANEAGSVVATNGQILVAEQGKKPMLTAGFVANNVLQWCLYYPGVLDLADLTLAPDDEQLLSDSLTAYRAGDLLEALAKYPTARQPGSDSERIYFAALLLAVGQVEQAESTLAAVSSADLAGQLSRLAAALQQLIAAVKNQISPSPVSSLPSGLPTELLATSYYEQSRATSEGALVAALRLARQAASNSPEFGFAWERVAELEFGFGHTERAIAALDRSLSLSPRNAQALALKGFLSAARNNTREAIDWFDRAMAVDSALGNAWLGRGLCRIRRGDRIGGREDLLVAAALEPQRALLRSYLGKAFQNADDWVHARHELELASRLDPTDPTAWLYSALLNQQDNRFNEGIRDLEKSQELNDNRRLYRSRLLLDQDRAVRSSSLADLYQDAGMPEVSAREAARAVNYDYANFSAHLFLAESADALRDPTRFNLRHETVWFNELLLANLLAPVGGTTLSQNISQQEYSRLFEQNRIGLSSWTEYRSDEQVRELASQFGRIGNTGWSLDLDYQHNNGVRPNNELDRIEWYSTIKQQLTPKDSVMLLVKYQDYHSGDNFQYYDPSAVTTDLEAYNVTNAPVIRTNYTFDEYQHPWIVAGYHHEWSPGIHTLLLGGWLENDQRFTDTQALLFLLRTNADGRVIQVGTLPFDVGLRSQFEMFTSELNQIFQGEHQHLVFGGRFQSGEFESTNLLTLSSIVNPIFGTFFNNPPAATKVSESFEHVSGYGYYSRELFQDLWLTAGLSYDRLEFPENFRQPPIASGTGQREKLSPKAALVWSPLSELTLRGIYSRGLGGVSFDESFRLEPTQLAGFNQSFRTIISESIVGSVSAPVFEVGGLALDTKLKNGTYLGIQAELLNSEVRREVGAFSFNGSNPAPPPTPRPIQPFETRQNLDYEERSITATINQLACDSLSFGAQYRFTQAELRSSFSDFPESVALAHTHEQADLHQTTFFALFNHPCGFFARAEGLWNHQSNSGYKPSLASTDLVQGNIFVGWRLKRQRGELTLGLMNVGNADYHLNPLTPYSELPRERVFVARLRFNL